MKPLFNFKHKGIILIVYALSACFSSCEKYTFTPTPPPAPGYYDYVNAGIVYNGNLIIAGNFSTLYNSAKNIAQWNGSDWQSLGAGVTNGNNSAPIITMALYNSNLIAGGFFDSAGGQPTSCIAQWNGSSWLPMGSGVAPTYFYNGGIGVTSMVIYNGNLIVAGGFLNAGVANTASIAQWNGTTWQTVGGGTKGVYEQYIQSITIYNGNLIAGGLFDTIGGQHISNLAQWNGTSWSSIGKANGTIYCVFTYNGNVIVQGNADTIGGISTSSGYAEWNGTTWTALNSLAPEIYENFLTSPMVYNSIMYFNNSNNIEDTILSAWSGSGSPSIAGIAVAAKVRHWMPSNMIPTLNSLCIFNGRLIVGGWFTSVNGVNCSNNLAQWDGTNWSAF